VRMDKGMLATTLRYPYELRQAKPYFSDVKAQRLPRETVKLAEHILDTKAGHFDPSKFKDEYENALKTLVRRKAKGKAIEVPQERPEPSNVINLMDALRQSVEGAKSSKAKGKRRARKAIARHMRRAATRHRKAA